MSNLTVRSQVNSLPAMDSKRGAILKKMAQQKLGTGSSCTLTVGTAAANADRFVLGGVGYTYRTVATAFTPTLTVVTTATLGTFNVAHGLSVDDIIRSSTEYMRVAAVLTSTTVTLERGFAGSAIANGYTGATVVTAAAYGTSATALRPTMNGDYIIPTAGTYTNSTMDDLIVAAVNYWEGRIGAGITAVLSATTGSVDFVSTYLLGPKVLPTTAADGVFAVLADGSVTTMTTVDASGNARNAGLKRGDIIKVESEYLSVVSCDASNGASYTVTRGWNGSSGAAHTGNNDSITILTVPNYTSRLTGSGAMSQWTGGVDDLTGTKTEVLLTYGDAGFASTTAVVWGVGTVAAARATLFDASAAGVQIPSAASGGAQPSITISGRKVSILEGTTAYATSDKLLVEIWY